MADGPLIVQSDKTLLLEVDHAERAGRAHGDRSVRRAGARTRARPHLPRHPVGAVERARGGPRRRAGRRRARALLPLRRSAAAARRHRRHDGPLRAPAADELPGPRPGHDRAGPGGAGGGAAPEEDRSRCSAPGSTRTRWSSTRPSAATSSRRCSRWAGPRRTSRATSTARPTPSRCARRAGACAATRSEAVEGFWAGGSGVIVLPCGAGQDAGRCGRDGAGAGHHADPGHQHRRRAPVEAGADRAHVAHRGRDRRVLRRAQGDPARSRSPRTR